MKILKFHSRKFEFQSKITQEANALYSDYEKIDKTKVEKVNFHKNEVCVTVLEMFCPKPFIAK